MEMTPRPEAGPQAPHFVNVMGRLTPTPAWTKANDFLMFLISMT